MKLVLGIKAHLCPQSPDTEGVFAGGQVVELFPGGLQLGLHLGLHLSIQPHEQNTSAKVTGP